MLYSPVESSKQKDQDDVIKILDQVQALNPEWHEAIINAKNDILRSLMKVICLT
jgi:hypothetical protein